MDVILENSDRTIADNNFKMEIKQLVRQLDIPFNWNLHQVGVHSQSVIPRLEEKDEEITDPMEYKFRNFVLQILLAYEYFNNAESLSDEDNTKIYMSVLQRLKDCENLLHEYKQNNCKEAIYTVSHYPFLVIILGCKAFVMTECSLYSEAKEILKQIEDLSHCFDDVKHKAAMFGIKAHMLLEYGNEKFFAALEFASQARQLDPSIGEWHFVFGNLMARIRRVKQFMEPPQKEEIASLEKAVELTNYGRYHLHLAQTYREEGFRIFNTYRFNVKNNQDKVEEVEKLNSKAYNIYRKLIDENPDNPRILARCAFGITKMPVDLRDVDLAVQSIERAIKLSPNNPMINHYIAIIYERYCKKTQEAKKFYKIANDLGVFGAGMDLIRLRFAESPKEYNPVPDLEAMAQKYLEQDRKFQTLSQIASYYFFHKSDITEAWKHLEKIVAFTSNHSCIRTHKSLFLRMNVSCDLCEVIFDEVKLKIAHKKFDSDEENKMLMEIGCSLRKECPNSHPFRYDYLKNKILDESKRLIEGRSREVRKGNKFNKKGGKKFGGNSKQINSSKNFQTSNRDRSKSSNRKNSQQRSFNRADSKVKRDGSSKRQQSQVSGYVGGNNLDSNQAQFARDRSNSSNKKSCQQRSFSRDNSKNGRVESLDRRLSKERQKTINNSRSSSTESISELKFSDTTIKKWQQGSEGTNTGKSLIQQEWFNPTKRSSNNFKVDLHMSSYYRKDYNNTRTRSLDRFGNHSCSGVKNFRRNEVISQKNSSRHSQNYGNNEPNHFSRAPESYKSFENVSRPSAKVYDNRSSGRLDQNTNKSNFDWKNEKFDFSKQKRSESLPLLLDPSVEMKASMFLPKFCSRKPFE